jgi:hypothetical protein
MGIISFNRYERVAGMQNRQDERFASFAQAPYFMQDPDARNTHV